MGRPANRTAAEVRAAARYLTELGGFMRRPPAPARARQLIEEMRGRRERHFLQVVERGVLAPGGIAPYRALLRHAGFDFERISEMVRREGIEGSLERLYDAGVRLSLDEFKGRSPIVRPGLEVETRVGEFDNPLAVGHFAAQTGGSTARPRRVMIDLAEVAHEAAHLELTLGALGFAESPQAAWFPPPPSVAGIKWALRQARRGRAADRWFAQRPVRLGGGEATFAAFTGATYGIGWLCGRRLPWPEHTPPAQAERVATWLAEQCRVGHPAVLRTYPSSAVRICRAAEQARLAIDGTLFALVGEPCTPARKAAISVAGARVVCDYYITEAGQIGTPCADPRAVDDVHVMVDRVSLSTRRREPVDGRAVDSIVVSTLVPSAPQILLNVETGDCGVLERRACSCPIGALGFSQHLHTIRSYEKVVGEGMSFLGAELVEVVEEVLPGQFGGDPADYQLVEEEQDGLTSLLLLVHPRLGPLDDQAVVRAAIERLGAAGSGQAMMADIWRLSDTLRVVRREPHSTTAGKTPTVHVGASR